MHVPTTITIFISEFGAEDLHVQEKDSNFM